MSEAPPAPVWVDSHCHLYMHGDDPADLLGRAAAAGVAWIVCPGVDADSSATARRIASAFPSKVRWSAGLHPHDASRFPEQRERLEEMAGEADAIGECGLDYYRDLAPRDHQFAAFEGQIELARRVGKPLIVHCRDAFADVHRLLETAALGERAVMHCWSGGSRWTKRFEALGVTFSFAGTITYDGAETLRLAARHVPPERAMVETDTPYLSPEPHRHQRNEPALVGFTGRALAAVWGVDPAAVAEATSATAGRIFGVPR